MEHKFWGLLCMVLPSSFVVPVAVLFLFFRSTLGTVELAARLLITHSTSHTGGNGVLRTFFAGFFVLFVFDRTIIHLLLVYKEKTNIYKCQNMSS